MKIAHDVLGRYVPVPEPAALRLLLDDLGLEVKRFAPPQFTLELLANRGDHHCYEGVAREVAARLRSAVTLPPVAALTCGTGAWAVRVETPLCLRYSATLLEKTEDGSMSASDLRTLDAADIHAISPAIDATNLSNLELGQPTHAFDADTLEGPVTVRTSRAGERAWPLFRDAPVDLPEGTLVIADDRKILAIAGVIGCEESKTTPRTTRILLESATFDPVSVRKASRALEVHTDASARFERGADPERVLLGAGRVVHLMERAGWRRVGPTVLVGGWSDPRPVLPLDIDALNAFLDTRLTRDEAADILTRLGFSTVEDPGDPRVLAVTVPPRRQWDVTTVQDLVEEVVRIVGYNETPVTLPPVGQGAVPSPDQARKLRVDQVLTAAGFYEVFTDGFYGRDDLERLALPEGHALLAHVSTLNALDRGYSLLKNNALLQAVDAVAANLARRTQNILAYEWTRTFHPVASVDGGPPCSERRVLWAIAAGHAGPGGWSGPARPADVWFFKGLLRELAIELGLDLTLGAVDEPPPIATCLHPRRWATVTLAGVAVGVLGEVHPALLKRWKIKGARPVYLEIVADALFTEGSRPMYVEPPTLQPIERSLAFTLPYGFEAGRVRAWLHASGPDWLERVDIVDLFAHTDETGAPVRTVTYTLTFANAEARASGEGGRTAEDVNAVTLQLVDAVRARFGDQGVALR